MTIWVKLEGIMLSEISQAEKNKLLSLKCGIQKKPSPLKWRVEWWLPGPGECRKCRDIVQRVQTSSCKIDKF